MELNFRKNKYFPEPKKTPGNINMLSIKEIHNVSPTYNNIQHKKIFSCWIIKTYERENYSEGLSIIFKNSVSSSIHSPLQALFVMLQITFETKLQVKT